MGSTRCRSRSRSPSPTWNWIGSPASAAACTPNADSSGDAIRGAAAPVAAAHAPTSARTAASDGALQSRSNPHRYGDDRLGRPPPAARARPAGPGTPPGSRRPRSRTPAAPRRASRAGSARCTGRRTSRPGSRSGRPGRRRTRGRRSTAGRRRPAAAPVPPPPPPARSAGPSSRRPRRAAAGRAAARTSGGPRTRSGCRTGHVRRDRLGRALVQALLELGPRDRPAKLVCTWWSTSGADSASISSSGTPARPVAKAGRSPVDISS